jgi:DNA polymerase III delta prime subunit
LSDNQQPEQTEQETFGGALELEFGFEDLGVTLAEFDAAAAALKDQDLIRMSDLGEAKVPTVARDTVRAKVNRKFMEPEKQTDPLKTLGAEMLYRAVSLDDGLDDLKDAGAIIFRVPSPEWCDRGLLEGIKSEINDPDSLKPCMTFVQNEEEKARPRRRTWGSGEDSSTNDIVNAFWSGERAIGLCHDIEAMLPALVSAADHIIDLPAFDADMLLHVIIIHTAGDTPSEDIPEWLPGVLAPNDLRLARRLGQTADDYLVRLVRRGEAALALAAKEREALESDLAALDTLHGADDAVAWGKGLKKDVAAFREGEIPWSDVDRGALISGPPGTGKTTFARKLAKALGVPLVACSYGEWQSVGTGHLGDVIRAIRASFSQARELAQVDGAVILSIDELDSIQGRGVGARHDDWWSAITNTLLDAMDGVADREGVVTLGLTNRPEIVDPALKRAGRLDRHIVIGLPTAAELAAILAQHLGPHGEGLDLLAVTRSVRGTGADAEKWARGARRRARHAGREVTLADIVAEIGDEKPKVTAELNRRRTIHEAGHAVVMERQRPGSVMQMSITGGGGNLGGVFSGEIKEHRTMRVEDLENRAAESLAGRAAEQVLLGDTSLGSGGGEDSDLAQATKVAAMIDTQFAGNGSLLWLGEDAESLLRMRPDVARAVSERLNRIYEGTLSLVARNRSEIEAVAALLAERETLTGDEVREAMRQAATLATHAGTGTVQ